MGTVPVYISVTQTLSDNPSSKLDASRTYHLNVTVSPCAVMSPDDLWWPFAILYLTRHLPIYHTLLIIIFSLSLHLSFTPNLRLISSSNHSCLSLLAHLHSRFSGSLNLALLTFYITIIVTVSLIVIVIISSDLLICKYFCHSHFIHVRTSLSFLSIRFSFLSLLSVLIET